MQSTTKNNPRNFLILSGHGSTSNIDANIQRPDSGRSGPSGDEKVANPSVEGLIAGIIGASIIAIWFFIIDLIQGRPFYTPDLLGTALFRAGEHLSSPEHLKSSLNMTLMYTWVHYLIFAFIGGIASWLLNFVERNPNLGFGILLLFVLLGFFFIGASFLFASPILGGLAWPAVLIGNLLAAAGMAGYLWYRHPSLTIRP